MNAPGPITFDAVRSDPKLPSTAFRVAEYLNRYTKRCYDECFRSTETIARAIGKSARTVQRALKYLALAGYILVIADRTLNSGHRIRMGWRAATVFPSMRPAEPDPLPAPNPSINVDDDPAPVAKMSPGSGVPPDPPIGVSEDSTLGRDDDRPGAGDPASGHPAPEEVVVAAPALPGPAEEEVPAAVIAQAEQVFGPGPGTVGRVMAFARQYTSAWVAKALGIAQDKARKEPVQFGYLRRTLEGFAAECGPPEQPAVPASLEDQKARLREIRAARKRGLQDGSPGGGPCAPSTTGSGTG